MSILDAAHLLAVWDRGYALSPVSRALLLLEAARHDPTHPNLDELPVGARDARLLLLRRELFGDELDAVSRCESCGELLDLSIPVEGLHVDGSNDPLDGLQVEQDGFAVRFRLPTSDDLLRVSSEATGPVELLERCLLSAYFEGEPIPVRDLTEPILARIEERMEEADPQAAVEIALHCPVCEHGWSAPFDIVSFLWTEIDAWARRILRDVHALASNYGWREADILAMTPRRRQIYLDLIRE